MGWDTCNNIDGKNAPHSMRSSLWKQTAAGRRCMKYTKDRLVLPPPVTDIVDHSTVSISSLSSGDTGKYSTPSGVARQHHYSRQQQRRQQLQQQPMARPRRPPIPEEEAVFEQRHATPNKRKQQRHDRIFHRRDILRLADREQPPPDDPVSIMLADDGELSLCSRDLEIKSAAGSKALAPDLDRCISATSSSGESGGILAPKDPPGSRHNQNQTDALLNIERLLVDRSPSKDDKEKRKKEAPETTTNGLDRALRSPGKSEMRKKRAKETKPSNKSGIKDVAEQKNPQKSEVPPLDLSDIVDQREPPLAGKDQSMHKLALDPEESPRVNARSRLEIAKMDIANRRAAANLPVVFAESIGSTQAERLDRANVTIGHKVLDRENVAEYLLPFGERRARKQVDVLQHSPEQAGGATEIDLKHKEASTDDRHDMSSASSHAQTDSSSARGSITVTCTSKDVTEKAGTARKKLLDVKNVRAEKLPPASELTDIDKFCGMIGSMFLCE